MHRRQPLPRLWLMTDERQGAALWQALTRLPRGSGVVFRHYELKAIERRELFRAVSKLARRRRLLLLVAGRNSLGPARQFDGTHNAGHAPGSPRGIRSASAHNVREIRAAERAGVDLIFISPVFLTRSHPGARPLGRVRFGLLARQTKRPVVAVGGMNASLARGLPHAYGWAGIDAWTA